MKKTRNSKLEIRSPLVALMVLVLACGLVWAGETGKIRGIVTDASTGQPVIGAVVEIEGTELGANTEEDGSYQILNVPAGTWNVTVSGTGLGTSTQSDVLVIADQTANANFRMASKVIQVEGKIIKAERPMVIRTAVQTTRVVTSAEFARLPVAQLGQLVGLQAGVTQSSRGGWTHIRGGRYNDVSYLVDGVSAKDALVGTLWSSPRPTAENIAEVSVITGSFDAEYGEAMSGVIQTVTREGGERTSSRLRYTTDEVFPNKDLNFGYNLASWTLGGPLIVKPWRYFVSTEYFRTNDASEGLFQVESPRSEFTVEGKTNYSLPKGLLAGGNLKVIADAHYSNYEWHAYSHAWKYLPEGNFANRVRSNKANLRLNYLTSGQALIELAGGFFRTALLRAPRDYTAENEDTTGITGFLRDANLWNTYKFKSEEWVFNNPEGMSKYDALLKMYRSYRKVEGGETLFDKWGPGYRFYDNPYGVAGTFVSEGFNYFHFRTTYNEYVKGSITLNPNKVHELKTGFELKKYDLQEYTNSMPYDNNPFYERYEYKPFTAAAYVQDKADFEDLVVRGGVRFDFLDAATSYRVFPESIGSTPDVADSMIRVGYKWRVSPRLGLSYPVTDRVKFRFSYGHFFRNPDFSDLYASQFEAQELTRRGNIQVGNPNMSAEKTVGYEMGFDAQLTDVFEFDFTAFFKDVYDLSGSRNVPAVPMGYSTFYNSEYARIQGFEATMSKAIDQYWSARLGYTLSVAKGSASTAWSQYGNEHPVQTDFYLDQDQRHAVNADIGLTFDRTFAFVPLRNFDVSVIGRYATGLPYSPTNFRGEPTGQTNSARMQPSFSLDSRISKTFNIGKVNLNLTCDIFNLLNAEIVTVVYAATGKADYDGRIITVNEFSPLAYQVGDPAYHPARDYNHDGYVTRMEKYLSYVAAYHDYTDRPLNYGASRKIRFGISLGF